MENLEKDVEILDSAIKNEYSLEHLLNLYKSNKYSPYLFSKKIVYIFMFIGIFLFILGLLNYSSIIIVIGFLIFSYFRYYLGNMKGYEQGSIEGLSEGFEKGFINVKLDLLRFLLKYKSKKYDEPEKAMVNVLTMALSGKFSYYDESIKDDKNKDLIEFKLKKIIDKEKEYYFDMGFKK